MPRREKTHDCALSSETAVLVRKRRVNPDGVERQVVQLDCGRRYPWTQLNDGDFFIAPIIGSEKAMRVAFHQAAVRHDIEISIHPWELSTEHGPVPAFRVVRIIGGIAKIKAEARKRGAHAPSSDVKRFYLRQAAWRRGDTLTTPPAISIAPTPPTAPPVPIGEAATAPLGTDAARRRTREEMLAEAQRKARLELAGLGPEDEDIMDVGGGVSGESKI